MPTPMFSNNQYSIVDSNRILYTPSPFARSSLMHLQEIGKLTARKPHISSRRDLQSYLFFMVADGEGNLTYDGIEYSLTKGSCVFIDCRHPYSHTTSEENLWTLHWCHFYGPMLSLIYEKYTERGGRPAFVPKSVDEFSSLWEKLFAMAGGNDYIRDMRINEMLNSLLTLLMSESWHESDHKLGNSKRAAVLPVKQYLEEHYNERITLDGLAEQFFISKYYLTHVFKEQFDMSISNYLLNVRITHAKQMLRFTDKSIEEVGIESGIGALHYFSRVFKNVEGVSPSEYRKQW